MVMGQTDDRKLAAKDANKAKNERLRKAAHKATGDGNAWLSVQADALQAMIGRVIKQGDAISIGQTRDGGAVVITLLVEKERYKYYGASAEELNEIFTEIWEAYG